MNVIRESPRNGAMRDIEILVALADRGRYLGNISIRNKYRPYAAEYLREVGVPEENIEPMLVQVFDAIASEDGGE